MPTGITATTWQNMVIDEGVAWLDYGEPGERIIGATNGGVSFGFRDFNMREPEIDGLKGPLMGASRVTQAVPQLTIPLVELSLDNLLLGLPGAAATQSGTGAARIATIARDARLVPLGDYATNVAIVGRLSGGEDVVVVVKNAIVMGGISIPMNPSSESTVEMVFVGHYDAAEPEDEPWEIIYPDPE